MIELPLNAPETTPTRLAVIGLGSAGCNVLDRLVLDGLPGAELVAVNTDVQGLSGSVASRKVQIGMDRTRGLGAGGDPEVGMAAAQESLPEVMAAIGDANAVVFLVGLGGGTGSGALATLADAIRDRGAHVMVIATMPFGFEGARRRAQAMETLAAMDALADILICFENERMSELVSAKTGIREAFAQVDQILAEAVRGLDMLGRGRGLLHAGLADVSNAFNGEGLRALFGVGEASDDNRAHAAVELALRSPLLDRGRALKDAEAVVVHLAGGADLTLHETQTAMAEVRRQLPEQANVFCGLAVDPALGSTLRVTIMASTYVEVGEASAPAPVRLAAPVARPQLMARRQPAAAPAPARVQPRPAAAKAAPVHHEEPLELDVEMPAAAEAEEENGYVEAAQDEFAGMPAQHASHAEEEVEDEDEYEEEEEVDGAAEEDEEVEAEVEQMPPPAAPVRPRVRPLFAPMQNQNQNLRRPPAGSAPAPASPVAAAAAPKSREEKQEHLQFEPVHRGRFEKSEPTIIDGQNLDVPTFMRRNVRVE